MNRKQMIKTMLVFTLFSLGLGGWLLHARIHPLVKNPANIIPFAGGMLSAFCVPFLFYLRPAIALAYIINGFLAIIGTILMGHSSIIHFEGPVTPVNIILKTTFADIVILWGKFGVGKALFDLEFLKSDADVMGKGRYFRYPNMGWWWAHLFSVTAVYALGHIFWK